MILLLAGTIDARLLLRRLKADHQRVAVSVTTEYGAALLAEEPDRINQRKLDAVELQQLLADWQITLVVDATHPYAAEASKNALHATQAANIPYFRFERSSFTVDEQAAAGLLHKVASTAAAAAAAGQFGETVFLTTGSKTLPAFVAHPALQGKRIVARVLPETAVLAECRALGLQPRDIVALQGPFSEGLNRELFLAYDAQVVVTKESGTAGGCDTKVAAALALGIPVVMIERPALAYGRSTDDIEELLRWIGREQHGIHDRPDGD